MNKMPSRTRESTTYKFIEEPKEIKKDHYENFNVNYLSNGDIEIKVNFLDSETSTNSILIYPNDFYIETPNLNSKKEDLELKIKKEQNKIKQKSGINTHKSKKYKRYF